MLTTSLRWINEKKDNTHARSYIKQSESNDNAYNITCCPHLYVEQMRRWTSHMLDKLLANQKEATMQVNIPVVHICMLIQ